MIVSSLIFDAGTAEFAEFDIRLPISWDDGDFTVYVIWHAGRDDGHAKTG